VLWLTSKGLEELPHLSAKGYIKNNFHPICQADNKYLTSQTILFTENGRERFKCIVSAAEGERLPSKITVSIQDAHKNEIKSYSY
jgi:hypothetical protein